MARKVNLSVGGIAPEAAGSVGSRDRPSDDEKRSRYALVNPPTRLASSYALGADLNFRRGRL
jgi:hypothetical protein